MPPSCLVAAPAASASESEHHGTRHPALASRWRGGGAENGERCGGLGKTAGKETGARPETPDIKAQLHKTSSRNSGMHATAVKWSEWAFVIAVPACLRGD